MELNADDLRFETPTELDKYRQMILAAASFNYPIANYAVEFRGAIVDCVAIQRGENEWIPVAIMLPEAAWGDVPQRSDDYPATKQP